MKRDSIGPLVNALASRASDIARVLLPAGVAEGNEWASSSKNHPDIGAVSVVVTGAKAGRVGFWGGRPDAPGTNGGDLLHLIMAVHRCDLKAAMEHARSYLGGAAPVIDEPRAIAEREDKTRRQAEIEAWKIARVRELHAKARPLLDSEGVRYLLSRGIDPRRLFNLSDRVRFLKSAEWWQGARREGNRRAPGPYFPAIICAVDNIAGEQHAGHFTFLSRDLTGKAPVEKPKLMMGPVGTGQIYLRRAAGAGVLQVVNEGMENGLTAMMAHGPADEAIVSPSLAQLKHVPVFDGCMGRIICPHNDWSNEGATREFERSLDALRRQGVPLRVLRASGGVNDLNDMVKP